ncbi:hypothetical protein [Geodermatophilus sabuli]|uniref:Uncharacterized protein n=1 Tax=Geodermatophilus sabuli TaxID=1564158 RepID=A0A285EF45_9ACTN|nr:hypothetical protein [Geodermatophilus sabuli]MBB3086596.1 hypothetical protein [Geodermatophilus sabuli]SNX97752.1 hypothetical protein SAMN06893097_108117 [Geodermatophilus sabuli]
MAGSPGADGRAWGTLAPVVNGGSVLTAERTTPEAARRTWPQWLAGGLALVVVAMVSVFWDGGGARLLLGVTGVLTAARGLLLARAAGRSRGLGAALAVGGLAAVAVAVLSAGAAGWVLLGAVPLGLLTGALVLLARGGAVRRNAQAALVWAALVTGLLVVTGVATTWSRAADGATVVAALAVGLLGVFLVVGAFQLRTLAAQPPAPVRPAGCANCACGAGGCGTA